jgi:hypothetical protein
MGGAGMETVKPSSSGSSNRLFAMEEECAIGAM